MEFVPLGPLLTLPPDAWVVVAETVNYNVPDGSEPLGEEMLAELDPRGVRYEMPAAEVGKLQVGSLPNGFRVLTEPSEQVGPRRVGFVRPPPFARAFGNRFSHAAARSPA